ncbi:MAG: N-acetylmuramic acid 6-phosphate etherase [Phycisphaerae bacterium]
MVHDRSHIETEKRHPASAHLDEMPVRDAVLLMNREDQRAVAAVGQQAAAIAQAVEMAAAALRIGGRLIYVGAGTSGRMGFLDAAECPPTFSSDPGMVVGIIAGGVAAIQRSLENVEDDALAGAQALRDIHLTAADVVVGIAAGGTTPFVHGAIAEARKCGTKTIFLTCTRREHITAQADVFICLETGPEVLTGSTRLKAGTATKLVLNTISTLAMTRIGKVFGNIMVDLDCLKNHKLLDRGMRIIMQITGVNRMEAQTLLQRAGGQVKRAIVMQKHQCDALTADHLLKQAHGFLRKVIE